MNKILLLFVVVLIFESINAFPSRSGSLITRSVTRFCASVAQKKQTGLVYYRQALETLNQFENIQKFAPETVGYLHNTGNINRLLAGGDSCKQYFVGLKTAIQEDGQMNRLTAQDIQQKIDQFVDQSLDKIVSMLSLIKD